MCKQIVAFVNWLLFGGPAVKIESDPDYATEENDIPDESESEDDEIVATDFVSVPDHIKTTYNKSE